MILMPSEKVASLNTTTKADQLIWDNGKVVLGMALENKFGKMEPLTGEIGDMARQKVSGNSLMLMETFMKETG